MSYISGQHGPFDDQMLRIGASDNYFLSPPPFGGADSTGNSTGNGTGTASASASAISMDSDLNLGFLQHPGLEVRVKEEDRAFPVLSMDHSISQARGLASGLADGRLTGGLTGGVSLSSGLVSGDSMIHRDNDSSYTSPMSSQSQSQSHSHSHSQGQGQGQGQVLPQGQGHSHSLPHNQSESSGMKADSEEEQIRRKRAMNRAAQKAFRERKEARVKQLEQQLKDSERDREQLLSELEDLRKHNIEMHAENRILLQTKSSGGVIPGVAPGGIVPQQIPSDSYVYAQAQAQASTFTFPSKRDFVEELIDLQDQTYDAETVSRTQPVNYSHNGEQMMTISATWEYLHKVSERIDFDLSLVMCKLKGKQVCHGKGPSFYKSDVDRYIQESNQGMP